MSILGKFLAFKTTTVTLLAAGWIRNSIRCLHLDQCSAVSEKRSPGDKERQGALPSPGFSACRSLEWSPWPVRGGRSQRRRGPSPPTPPWPWKKNCKKNIPSNWTITSPTTSSLLYRSKERTTKCRVRICKEATVSTCFWWTLWIFNRFQINFLFAIGKFCVFKKVPVQCTCEWHTSEACQAQSLKSLTRK